MVGFTLLPEQEAQLEKWIKEGDRLKSYSCDGTRLTYTFTPTSFGVVIKVKDVPRNEEIDLSDYENW